MRSLDQLLGINVTLCVCLMALPRMVHAIPLDHSTPMVLVATGDAVLATNE